MEGTPKIGENALLRDADNPRIKRELRELRMILVQHRENHRIWELKEGVERRWTCGKVEYYGVESKKKKYGIYWLSLIASLRQLSPGGSGVAISIDALAIVGPLALYLGLFDCCHVNFSLRITIWPSTFQYCSVCIQKYSTSTPTTRTRGVSSPDRLGPWRRRYRQCHPQPLSPPRCHNRRSALCHFLSPS